MTAQPTGTVTMLFTDIEGSTRLLQELGSERYAEVLDLHRRLLRECFERHDGYEVDCEGDAFFLAFGRAEAAVAAASQAQTALAGADWPEGRVLRVRMGIHTGEPVPVPPKYVGMDVHRAARIMAAGHGGQVLVSQATAGLLDGTIPLRDLGEHRLKDLLEAERLHQLGDVDFPPLKSLNRSNLPVAAWPLVGRERELGEIALHVAGGVRLLTLTGPGGSGKTRLALQAAAELSDGFPDGVFFVALAPLREAGLVRGVVAQALEVAEEGLDDALRRRLLLVLDNAEHLDGIESVVLGLLAGEAVLFVTSRAPLRLAAEQEVPVDALPVEAAAELFVARAAAVGVTLAPDEAVRAVCLRLDNLPLALELAAARTKLLTPAALLTRLDRALPLLIGNVRDAPERQQTLRATIEWSHDLLAEPERCLFRRLAVFRGSWSLEVAEEALGAEFEAVASLVDQSLVKRLAGGRFLTLETVREFALEKLDEAGERPDFERRHAAYYLDRLEQIEPILRGPRTGEFLSWFEDEEDNLRAALDWLSSSDPPLAARLAVLLTPYWGARGRALEGRERLHALGQNRELSTGLLAGIWDAIADLAMRLGILDESEAAANTAIALGEETDDPAVVASCLRLLARAALVRGDENQAVALCERGLVEAEQSGDERIRLGVLDQLGVCLIYTRRFEEARAALEDAAYGYRLRGDRTNEANELGNLAIVDFQSGQFAQAQRQCEAAIEMLRAVGSLSNLAHVIDLLAYALLAQGDRRGAYERANEGLLIVAETREIEPLVNLLLVVALSAADTAAWDATRVLGAANRLGRSFADDEMFAEVEHAGRRRLRDLLGEGQFDRADRLGQQLSLEDASAIARTLEPPAP